MNALTSGSPTSVRLRFPDLADVYFETLERTPKAERRVIPGASRQNAVV